MAFMKPEYAHGEMHRYTNMQTHDSALVWRGEEPEGKDWVYDTQAGLGWYTRLSAPGYLDCTDWEGPFDSENEARAHWIENELDPDTGDELAEWSYADLKAEYNLDSSDPWGTCMAWWFAVAGEMFERGLWVPEEWRYWPSPPARDPDQYEAEICMRAGDAALSRFGDVLNRYASRLKKAGKSY